MPKSTQIFQQLPWIGGINTSTDPGMIPPNELTVADNVLFGTNGSREKREGIDFNFDNAASGSDSLVAIHDYWKDLGASKSQTILSADETGEFYSYDGSGVRTTLAKAGTVVGATLRVSAATFNNRVIWALEGLSNRVKKYFGTGDVEDLLNDYQQALSVDRSSSGTTRIVQISESFKGLVGDTISVSGSAEAEYNQLGTVTLLATSVVANDTISYTVATSFGEASTPETTIRIAGLAPNGEFVRQHLGRLWVNDKTDPDRLHYSETFNHELWGGYGDSGALDIGVGDGDPKGITAIFPTFKGELFVAKLTKLYRVSGNSPESFIVELISDGIGCVAHDAVASIDQDALMFVSQKGIHKISASSNFGDFESNFVSEKIQPTFQDDWETSRQSFIKARYLSEINSVAFAVSSSGSSSNDELWLYNFNIEAWYRWTNVGCEALTVANDADKRRYYFGTAEGRLAKSFAGTLFDTNSAGASQEVAFKVVTGIIFPGGINTIKGFKRFYLIYRPIGTHTIVVRVKIDNQDEQVLSYVNLDAEDTLGFTFVLGKSLLGTDQALASFSQEIDGYGRGIQIVIEQSGVNQEADIQGFGIEMEDAGDQQEVIV